MELSALKIKYSKHDQTLKDLFILLESQNAKVVSPISNEVLRDLAERTDKIFNAILSLATQDDLYSIYILYRSLLEHAYKSFYIFSKVATEFNDDTAEKYQKHFFISEVLAQQAGVLEMEDLINGKTDKTDFISFLVEKLPEMDGFDKENQKEISLAIKQFKLSEMIKFLHNNLASKNASVGHVFAQTLPEYSLVSTFTHGGSYASKIMDKFSELDKLQEELDRVVKISFSVCGITKENVLVTYRPDKEILNALKLLHEIRNIE